MDKNPIDRRAFLGVAAAGVGLAATGSLASPLVDAGDVVMPREFGKQLTQYRIVCTIECGTDPIGGYTKIMWLDNLDPSSEVVIPMPFDDVVSGPAKSA